MDLLFEILLGLLEVLLEVLLELFGEFLVDLGLRSLASVTEPPAERNPVLAVIGHLLLGAAVGMVSLAVLPRGFVHSQNLRVANLVLTPIAGGLLMSTLGRGRTRKSKRATSLETFTCGAAFAFTFALVRYLLAS